MKKNDAHCSKCLVQLTRSRRFGGIEHEANMLEQRGSHTGRAPRDRWTAREKRAWTFHWMCMGLSAVPKRVPPAVMCFGSLCTSLMCKSHVQVSGGAWKCRGPSQTLWMVRMDQDGHAKGLNSVRHTTCELHHNSVRCGSRTTSAISALIPAVTTMPTNGDYRVSIRTHRFRAQYPTITPP